MKLVYIAGKYSDKTLHAQLDNIKAAEKLAIELWSKDIAALCPHKNTALFDDVASWKTFMEGSYEMLKRCDAILMVSNWTFSKGAKLEWDYAHENNIPIFYKAEQVVEWSRK